MTRDTAIIAAASLLAICVFAFGINGRLAAADPHQFDQLLGLTGECTSTATNQPLTLTTN